MNQIRYEQERTNRYLIFGREYRKNEFGYCMNMVNKNKIYGILAVKIREEQEEIEYWFDITKKESIQDFYCGEYITYESLSYLLYEIFYIIKGSEDFLLKQEWFLLRPEFIFLDIETGQVNLCYLEVNDNEKSEEYNGLRQQFRILLQFFMEKIDYEEYSSVCLVYEIYQKIKFECIFIEDFLEIIEQSYQNSNDCQKQIECCKEVLVSESELIEQEEVDAVEPLKKKRNNIAIVYGVFIIFSLILSIQLAGELFNKDNQLCFAFKFIISWLIVVCCNFIVFYMLQYLLHKLKRG